MSLETYALFGFAMTHRSRAIVLHMRKRSDWLKKTSEKKGIKKAEAGGRWN